MNIGIIIPAHNEADFLQQTIESLLQQTKKAHQIIVVNDNSTDQTQQILNQYPQIKSIYRNSSSIRLPGAKVIQAFNTGLAYLNEEIDIICKFDADLIFPKNYLQHIEKQYVENPNLGMCGGVCSIKKNGQWSIENLTNDDHLRGPIKSYRKDCFQTIGGLKEAMGWDTLDELLARYFGWQVYIDKNLIVKHLRPTSSAYNPKAQYLQGSMFYTLRYGLILTLIASAKLAFKKKKIRLFFEYIQGYFKAKTQKKPYLVNTIQGQWIRKYRWKGIYKRIFNG